MMSLIGRICLTVVILSAVFFTAACSPVLNEAGEAVPAAPLRSEPIPAAPQAAPTATAAPESTATSQPEPAPAEPAVTTDTTTSELQMEIGEPVRGVEPAPPVPAQEPDMPADLSLQAAPGEETPLVAAIKNLAEQTGLPPEQINRVSVEAVEWSDTSLGCPQEGYMYAQVITPGYKIILEAEGVQYEYHTDEGTHVVLCQP